MIQYQTALIAKPASLCTQSIIGKLADTMLEMAFPARTSPQKHWKATDLARTLSSVMARAPLPSPAVAQSAGSNATSK